jgi:hypothetical protein
VEHTVRYAEAIGEEIELLSLPRILKLGGDIAITGIMVGIRSWPIELMIKCMMGTGLFKNSTL